jgi:hypothetical protein
MEKTKYATYRSDHITLEDIDNTERYFSKEELIELKNKSRDIIENVWGFKDIKDKALAEQMFKYGYLAAHIVYSKELK